MIKLNVTTLKVSLHRPSDNPIFGDDVTHMSIEDEAAGPFFVLSQSTPVQFNEVRLSLDEIEKIAEVAREMMKQYPEEHKK